MITFAGAHFAWTIARLFAVSGGIGLKLAVLLACLRYEKRLPNFIETAKVYSDGGKI